MPKLNRQSQHRPARETVKTREMETLRRENHRLAQQVSRLRREVEKATGTRDAWGGAELTPELVEDASARAVANHGGPQLRAVPSNGCPQPDCGGTLREVDLGRIRLLVCVVCKYRVVI